MCTGLGTECGMFETWMAGVTGIGAERPAGATDPPGLCKPYLLIQQTFLEYEMCAR